MKVKTHTPIRYFLILILVAICVQPHCFATTSSTVNDTEIGINLSHIHYWSSQWLFKDAMKQSWPWWIQKIGEDSWHESNVHIPLNSTGYPLEIPYNGYQVHTALFMHMDPNGPLYPEGTYTLRFKGEGVILLYGDTEEKIYTQANQDIPIKVTPSTTGIHLTLLKSNKHNPIRDIQFMMPNFKTNESDPFHPEFIQHIEPFSVLRFMKTTHVEEFKGLPWSERVAKNYYSQSIIDQNGLSHDYIIDLCNQTKKDPWLNIPHGLDDESIKQLASYYKDNLSPDLMLYVEYSNEFWNPLFPIYQELVQLGQEEGLGKGEEANARYGVKRTLEMRALFKEVYGDTYEDRVTWTLSTWAWRKEISQLILDELDKRNGRVEAFTIAPYFGGEIANSIGDGHRYSLDQIISMMYRELESETREQIRWHKAEAQKRDMRLLTYEAGSHFVSLFYPEDDHLKMLMAQVNADPRMETLYKKYFQIWSQEAGDLTVLFNLVEEVNDYGDFGLKRHYDDSTEDSPKWSATLQVIETLN